MKRSTFESKMFHMSNLGQPMNYDRVAHMGISTVAYIFLPRMSDSVFNINLRSAFGCYTIKQGVCVCVCVEREGWWNSLIYLFPQSSFI